MARHDLKPTLIVEEGNILKVRSSGWVHITKKGWADWYEKDKNGKFVKRFTIPFDPSPKNTLNGKYLIQHTDNVIR